MSWKVVVESAQGLVELKEKRVGVEVGRGGEISGWLSSATASAAIGGISMPMPETMRCIVL